MSRSPKYVYNIGDVIEDYECIDIIRDENNQTRYVMKCTKCGKIKHMLGSTIARKSGVYHKSCGKGLGITYDKVFYQRWESMRQRTRPNDIRHEYYYDRGITSDEFESFIDFYNAMYPSWKEHVKRFGEHDTSLERIDVDKPYTKENCTWVCMDEQKGNVQKTIYFTVEDIQTGEKTYHKNALRYALNNHLPEKYIGEVINKNRTYKGKKYTRITKQEYSDFNLEKYNKEHKV